MSEQTPATFFPHVAWKPEWPVQPPGATARIQSTAIALFLGVFAGIAVWMGIGGGVQQGHTATAVGAIGGATMFGGLALLALIMGWMPPRQPRSPVRHHVDPDHGAGVQLRPRRTPFGMYVLYLALAGIGAFGRLSR
ncbi:MAG: hypothetical protein J2P18_05125 [Nocardia sp.]|nr:hypothetical protein [Nocardia sp.]